MNTLVRQLIYDKINTERERQDLKYGDTNQQVSVLDFRTLGVVSKTLGDAYSAMFFMNRDPDSPDYSVLPDLEKNMVEVAASAIQMLEKLYAYRQA